MKITQKIIRYIFIKIRLDNINVIKSMKKYDYILMFVD